MFMPTRTSFKVTFMRPPPRRDGGHRGDDLSTLGSTAASAAGA